MKSDFYWRQRIRDLLVKGRLRPLSRIIYNNLVRLELSLVRWGDALLPSPKVSAEERAYLREVTAVIKTFERPHSLHRFVASIQRLYPELTIIVVDDSRQPSFLPGVKTVTLPYRSGVSAGRQAGLEQVTTPYMLNLDDDFIFYRVTNLAQAIAHLAEQPAIDIMGGQVIYLPFGNTIDYREVGLLSAEKSSLHPPGSSLGPFPVYDKVANFFLGRTERLRLVGWDGHLKVIDHADFFTRAQGVLTSVYNADFKCLHAKTPFDDHYMQFKEDILLDQAILQSRYGRPHH